MTTRARRQPAGRPPADSSSASRSGTAWIQTRTAGGQQPDPDTHPSPVRPSPAPTAEQQPEQQLASRQPIRRPSAQPPAARGPPRPAHCRAILARGSLMLCQLDRPRAASSPEPRTNRTTRPDSRQGRSGRMWVAWVWAGPGLASGQAAEGPNLANTLRNICAHRASPAFAATRRGLHARARSKSALDAPREDPRVAGGQAAGVVAGCGGTAAGAGAWGRAAYEGAPALRVARFPPPPNG